MTPPPVTSSPVRPGLGLGTQLTRFVVTGGFAAVVDYGSYQAMLAAGTWIHLAKAIAFVLGTLTAYLINRRWTFRARGGRTQLLSVLTLYALTFAVQVGCNAVALALLPPSAWRITLAFVVAQGTATSINFVVQRAVIFRS